MNITREMLFDDGAFFPSCHASTVLPLKNGVVLAAYFAGEYEKADDVAIWLSRKVDGVWLDPVKVAKVYPDVAHWNPVLMPIPGGARLVFKVGRTIPEWKSWTMTTQDAGATWSEPEPYPTAYDDRGPVRNKPLILADGSMLAPDSVETVEEWRPRIDVSCDYGASFPTSTWIPLNAEAHTGAPVPSAPVVDQPDQTNHISGKGAIQPTLWTSGHGMIHALLRTTAGYIYRSDSTDFGRTWCTAYNTGLPNNNSGIDIARLDGALYLVMNPVSGDWADRTPLVIMKSTDNGATFRPYVTLEDMQNDPHITENRHNRRYTAEFSYPAIVAAPGKLHVTYTYLRRQICYREITV